MEIRRWIKLTDTFVQLNEEQFCFAAAAPIDLILIG